MASLFMSSRGKIDNSLKRGIVCTSCFGNFVANMTYLMFPIKIVVYSDS